MFTFGRDVANLARDRKQKSKHKRECKKKIILINRWASDK